jgi:catalase
MAKFVVDDKVPRQFRYGVFSAPGTPQAIIRFSSGQPDIKPDKTAWSWLPFFGDVRGMAVKILDVEGSKLLDDHDPDDKTQDFIATNSPVFFIRTIDQYSQFSASFSRVDLGELRRYNAYFLPHWWYPPGWHLHQFSLIAKSLKRVPDSLVKETYYSGSAFRLGPTDYGKFRMRPCDANIKPIPPGKDQKGAQFDYLRLELENQAKAGNACFNFEVQPQVIGKNMPVEDTTVEWSEKDSPFQKIATITIDPQCNNTPEMNKRCENLEFNPWHSVEDFKPVGVMNRLRKVVYQQMADFRRKKNCEALCGSLCPGSYKACIDQCPWLKDPVPEKIFPDGCPAHLPAAKPGN